MKRLATACVNSSLAWIVCLIAAGQSAIAAAADDAPLPGSARAVWDLEKAHREATPTRERICINGLWRWQPAGPADSLPTGGWGYFKVPGCWPGITDYMQHDCQTVFAHPSWKDVNLGTVAAAWYQREISVPSDWAGRRVLLCLEYFNSSADVFIDGKKCGAARFPSGQIDLAAVCRAGAKHLLTLRVAAVPLQEIMLMFNDTNAARRVAGKVARRGLCGDVYLAGIPAGARIAEVKIDTSMRKGRITVSGRLEDIAPDAGYTLRATISEGGRPVREFSQTFAAGELEGGRFALAEDWMPERVWDLHTPQHVHEAAVSLLDEDGRLLDASLPQRFGFRELWIDGRDFYLNDTRVFLSALPLDNAQVSALAASYEGARESLTRLKQIGINFVYTHNYGCEPGSHLGFAEILRAADDVGMLVALSQPHFGQYDWQMPDAAEKNGYAHHARFYVRVAGSHPCVVFYAMSHNSTGYSEDMNPDMIDGVHSERSPWSANNVERALQAEAIVARLDPSRIIYHHSSGNLSSMHTTNFYTNMAPSQELDDWFEHWATRGVKPVFTCEYMVPCTWDWTMYRGWYKGARAFGSAVVPWEFCLAEWSAQFLGDRAYRIGEPEKRNIRWEAEQFKRGRLWHRWDYPYQVGSKVFDTQHEIIGDYLNSNWRAFRTWGVSAISPWEHHFFWTLREGVDKSRKPLEVDWENLQRPGFSPDYIGEQYERMDLAFEPSDWIPTDDGRAILRNNMPQLAYIAGKPAAFTSKDHNFRPGESVEKQIILVNNSRQTVTARCRWSLALPEPLSGAAEATIATGRQERIPLAFALPAALPAGEYELSAEVAFSDGQVQKDTFTVHVMPGPAPPSLAEKIAIFDPQGESTAMLAARGVKCHPIGAGENLADYNLLVVGKGALTADSPGPDLGRVRDGLKVIVFEQTAEALERRLGFRIAAYGLRRVFQRLPDHPLLAGLDAENLRDWRGSATLLPPRLDYFTSQVYGGPAVKWCGLEVPRVWRCGNRGNVASVLIEKPARGDFLPILDGGYGLQYSPLLQYREGAGLVLFCQLDVTGRTEQDPAAETLIGNLLRYAADWRPQASRSVLYAGGPAGLRHLRFAGVPVRTYQGGKLAPDACLVAASGAGRKLAENRAAIAEQLAAGGQLLALGLDGEEVNSFLPFKIGVAEAEHIAAYFTPPGMDSLLRGIAPADVHNRDPRKLPLVSSGAAVLGNGVLAEARGPKVAFLQLPPYAVSGAQGAAPSFLVDSQDALEGKQSALVTLGMTGGGGVQFGQRVQVAPQVGKTYTLAVFVKGVGGPVSAHLEVERAGAPWDRAVKGADVQIPEDQWTDLHVSFKCEKPFPEGWQAYIGCAQDGGQFRADLFRLYEGDYLPWEASARSSAAPAAASPANLFANPGFESGRKPWFYNYHEQLNLRRTYRGTSRALARLLANMGASAPTPLLDWFAMPVGGEQPGPSIVRNGDFSRAAAGDAMPDQWQFSSSSRQAACDRQPLGEGRGSAMRIAAAPGAEGKANVMLAQQNVPVTDGQWYRISLKARAEGMGGKSVTIAVQNTQTWTSLLEYQSFAPAEEWRTFRFLVQANGTAEKNTRLQIWHGHGGALWLADLSIVPVAPPSTDGRWSQGLYLDQPQAWDDPYRFFRW